MAKIKWTIAGPDDPIFKRGWTISTHRKKSNEVVCPKCNSNKAIFQYYNNEHDSPSVLESLQKKYYKVVLMGGVEFGIAKEFLCEDCSHEWNLESQ